MKYAQGWDIHTRSRIILDTLYYYLLKGKKYIEKFRVTTIYGIFPIDYLEMKASEQLAAIVYHWWNCAVASKLFVYIFFFQKDVTTSFWLNIFLQRKITGSTMNNAPRNRAVLTNKWDTDNGMTTPAISIGSIKKNVKLLFVSDISKMTLLTSEYTHYVYTHKVTKGLLPLRPVSVYMVWMCF